MAEQRIGEPEHSQDREAGRLNYQSRPHRKRRVEALEQGHARAIAAEQKRRR